MPQCHRGHVGLQPRPERSESEGWEAREKTGRQSMSREHGEFIRQDVLLQGPGTPS